MSETIHETLETPVAGSYDVLVAGAGPAGVAAAVCAARLGAKTCLVEQTGIVGGVSTSGLMSHWTGNTRGGIYEEILDRSKDSDDPALRQTINPDKLQDAYLRMLAEAGAELRLYTFVSAPLMEDGRVAGVIAESKSGRQALRAKVVVDASGDGDVAARAGAAYELGRAGDHAMQPMTLMFKLGGVDTDRAIFPGSFESLVDVPAGEIQSLGKAELPAPAGHVLLYRSTLPGVVTVNMTNLTHVDGTKAEDLTKAQVACHGQIDAIVDYMPAPTDIPSIKGTNPKTGEEELRHPSDSEPFSALAFKILTDPFVGKLCFFRVYSGKLTAGSYVYNATKGEKERIGRILRMHANHREEVTEVYTGEIAAVVGLKCTTTGDTLCDEQHPVILETMEFPDPVISIAVEPKTKAGQEKMGIALQKLAEEDPTFRVHTDKDTGQTIISGMGELHLEIIVDRLLREFKVEANVGNPQVAYKEGIRKAVHQESRFVRQSGGRGQYGHCVIDVEPLERGAGYEFVNKIVGGVIPKEYIGPIDQGIQEALQTGVLGGYPTVDLRVTLVDGSYHEVDSSEMAFKIAGSMAIKDACRKADPVLLEPIMKVSITVPEEYLGDVIGSVSSRRGRIDGMEDVAGTKRITAYCPMAEMFGYATSLRSMTQGRGTFILEPSHYEEVPKNVMDAVLKDRGGY